MDRRLTCPDPGDEVAWVTTHLADLAGDDIRASTAFRGGQTAADVALAGFDVTGYAATRSIVDPPSRRGASRLSPFVRHGLITLPRLWRAVAGGPARDVEKYRDELMWQEYARHVYARTRGMTSSLRYAVRERHASDTPWRRDMACLDLLTTELESDGWLVNQSRMWFASHWSVHEGRGWRDGEDLFFTHLLDGSRAANRLGWQWTVGAGTGRPYGFARAQVERQAPALCRTCALRDACPITDYPDDPVLPPAPGNDDLRRDPDPHATAGPRTVEVRGATSHVWITAESLGDDDPAAAAHPELPVVFVFDEALLSALRLSGKRLVFLAQCLADLGARREVLVWRGDPVSVLSGVRHDGGGIAATFTPVPGWQRRSRRIDLSEVHPWPWLAPPGSGPVTSFTAWRKRQRVDPGGAPADSHE